MKKMFFILFLVYINISCSSPGVNNGAGTRLPIDLREWNDELLAKDPVGYYELGWSLHEKDTRGEVVASLNNLYASSEDALKKLQYAMSLQALGAIDERILTQAYAVYARQLVEQEKVGIAFALFDDGGLAVENLNNEQLLFFLATANEHRLQQTTQRLLREAARRQVNVNNFDTRWVNVARTPMQSLSAVGTVLVDSGFVVRQGSLVQDLSLGSGFFIDRSGYFVTNYHVVAPAIEGQRRALTTISVRIDGKDGSFPAQIVGHSKITDMALLKVQYQPDFAFDIATFDTGVEAGQLVYALGSPLGLAASISMGTISNLNRNFPVLGVFVGNVMQIDVPINFGNSGGPLINQNGVVVGVAFAGLQQFVGINFALSADTLRVILPQMIFGDAVVLPYADLAVYDANRQVQTLYVGSRSQANAAGLEQFQVINKANNYATNSLHQLQMQVLRRYPNTLITIEQAGKKIPLVLYKRPPLPGAYAILRDGDIALFPAFFGAKLEEVERGRQFKLEHVYADMAFDALGFRVGDSFRYMGRFRRRGVPDNLFVAMVSASLARLGDMNLQLLFAASMEGNNWT